MDKIKFSDNFLYKTGERIIPGSVSKSVLSEHYSRYIFAQKYCKGKKVLNVACGAGYGSEVLLGDSKEVFNIDISEQLVAYGNIRYGNFKNHFLTMDAQKMLFPDSFFDVIVSFETFEHLPKHKDFIVECHRVLRDKGEIIISMPNKNITSPGLPKPHNQFHFKEWTLFELKKAISKHFQLTALYGQNFMAPVVRKSFIASVFFRSLTDFLYSKFPAVLLKILKIYFYKFKDIKFSKINVSRVDIIKLAKEKDFTVNNQNLAYAIMLVVLKKSK